MTQKKRGRTLQRSSGNDGIRKKRERGAWRRASGAEMNLTHHGALSTPPSLPTTTSREVHQTWTFSLRKKEKPECFRLLVKREFIIQLPAYCRREKVRASSSTLDSEKSPANIFSLSSLPAAGVIPWSARDVPCQIFFIMGGEKKRKDFDLVCTSCGGWHCPFRCLPVVSMYFTDSPHPPGVYPWCLIHAVSDVV